MAGGITMKKICSAMVVFSLAAFLLFTTVSIAPAQQAGPYVGVFGAFVVPEDLDLDNGGEIELDESWALGAKVGYIIPQLPWMAVELEYTYLAEQEYEHCNDCNFSSHNVMGNLLFRYPVGKIHPFIGFGLGISNATVEEGSWDDDDTGIASQFIIGVNFELMPNLSADLAYKYLYSEYEFNDIDTEAGNHLFQAGLNFHFK